MILSPIFQLKSAAYTRVFTFFFFFIVHVVMGVTSFLWVSIDMRGRTKSVGRRHKIEMMAICLGLYLNMSFFL